MLAVETVLFSPGSPLTHDGVRPLLDPGGSCPGLDPMFSCLPFGDAASESPYVLFGGEVRGTSEGAGRTCQGGLWGFPKSSFEEHFHERYCYGEHEENPQDVCVMHVFPVKLLCAPRCLVASSMCEGKYTKK